MKKTLLSLFFVAVTVATCLNFAACTDEKTTQNTYDNAESYLAGSQTYAATELTTMTIDWLKGEVVLVEDENVTEITVVEENDLEEDKKVHSYLHNGILEVRFWKSGHKGVVAASDKKVKITYPSVENLYVNVASRSVSADKINCSYLKVQQASGSLHFGDVVCSDFTVSRDSGSAEIAFLQSDYLKIKQASGKTSIGKAEITTAVAEQASGELALDLTKANSVTVKMASGSTTIKLPEGGATMTVKKTAGSFSADSDYTVEGGKYIFGEGKCAVDIAFTSGSVKVK